jgi:homoserine kinase type II
VIKPIPAPILTQLPPSLIAGTTRYLGGAGGFSGAELWRFDSSSGPMVLRAWPPEHPSAEHLRWLHQQLAKLAKSHIDFVPVPQPFANGQTYLSYEHRLWEFTSWLPGTADYPAHPSAARLQNALTALAQIHLALAPTTPREHAPQIPPTLLERSRLVDRLAHGELDQLAGAVAAQPKNGPLGTLAPQALDRARVALPKLCQQLEAARDVQLPLQPCLRDIWHAHVLFSGTTVTGIVDFGAMRLDTVVGDLTRLLGSLAADDSAAWQLGLAAYESLRPLAQAEQALLPLYDASNMALSPLSWIRWLYLDRRQFPDLAQVQDRFQETLTRQNPYAPPLVA